MATMDWAARARQFLANDAVKLQAAKTDLELRVATIDTHAVLESTLRGFLSDKQRIEGVLDKSKTSFRTVIQILKEETGDSILNAREAESILAFNRLRNYVAHDGYTPTYEEAQPKVALAAEVVRRLIGEVRHQAAPVWEAPFNSIASKFGSDFTYNLGVMLVVFSILYIINPIDIPGPLDDVGLTAPCIFSAAMLINAARRMRKRSSGKK